MKSLLLILFLIKSSFAFEYFDEGLVTKHDPRTENRNLFYAEYLTLGGKDMGFNSFMDKKRLANGLYLRSSIHTSRTVSHDEITGWLVSSKILGTHHGIEIWNQIKKYNGAYPAVVKDWTDFAPYNPSNYYAWNQLTVNTKWAYLYLPIYTANLMICANKPYEDTSCKIIYWIELSNMPTNTANDKLITYFDKKMTEMYGRKWLPIVILMQIYHNKETEDFPIFQAMRKLYDN